MNETASMLEARLRLIDRIRRVEHTLARDEQAKIAAEMMKGRSHDLGNLIQIMKLSSVELERRATDRPDLAQLVADIRQSADQATAVLARMFAAARPDERIQAGPVVTHAVRAAVDTTRPALAGAIELRIDLDDTVHTYSTVEELETMVVAAMLDASSSTKMSIAVRERVIQGKRWVEILRADDRAHLVDGELAHMFEPHSLLHVVTTTAKQAGGEVSLSPARGGLELAIELPIAERPLG